MPSKAGTWAHVNPFLFIRGLSCPGSVQTYFTPNCLKLTIPGFLYNFLPVSSGDISFKKNRRSSNGLEIRPQGAFTACRANLASANFWLSDPLQIVMAL